MVSNKTPSPPSKKFNSSLEGALVLNTVSYPAVEDGA